MIEYKAPNRRTYTDGQVQIRLAKIFLAGSIEMGTAENWQEKVKADLSDYDVVLFNPRRDDWDCSWVQSIHDPQFSEQVNWEMDYIEESNIILFYFDPKTMSPITLLEFGFCAGMGSRVIVCCPDGFWRKGNIEIVCERHDINLTNTYDEMIVELKSVLELLCYNA
jgi:hypothetical protein